MSTPRAGRIWVAIRIGDARSVQPCERIDATGLETRSVVPVEEGLHLKAALRFSGGSRHTYEVPVRVSRVDGGRIDAGGSVRVRLDFVRADPTQLREIAAMANALGVFQGEMPAYEPTAVRASGPLRATAQTDSAVWVLRFLSADERRAMAMQLLGGSLFVETRRPPPPNTRLLLRVDDPDFRPLYLEARVGYVVDEGEGPAGVGLVVERLPAIVANALYR